MYGDEIEKALVGRVVTGYALSADSTELTLETDSGRPVVLRTEGD